MSEIPMLEAGTVIPPVVTTGAANNRKGGNESGAAGNQPAAVKRYSKASNINKQVHANESSESVDKVEKP
jgi:hypothetical protein